MKSGSQTHYDNNICICMYMHMYNPHRHIASVGWAFVSEMWNLALLSTDMSVLGVLLMQECPWKKGLNIFRRQINKEIPYFAMYKHAPTFLCIFYTGLLYPWCVIIISIYNVHPYFPSKTWAILHIIHGKLWVILSDFQSIKKFVYGIWIMPPNSILSFFGA